MKQRYQTKSAVMIGLIRIHEGEEEILLQKRQNTGYADGYWDFSASGHVEKNESMRMSAVRETKEEIHVECREDDLEFIGMAHKYNNEESVYYNAYFLLKRWQGEPKIGEPFKCAEIKWFPTNALPENMIMDRKKALENRKKGIFYEEFRLGKNSTKIKKYHIVN